MNNPDKSITISKSTTNILSTNASSATLGQDNEKSKQPWLNAWRDPLMQIRCYTQGIRLSDLKGDGDYKLIVADLMRKLVVYKGANLDWQTDLAEVPIAVATFYSEVGKVRKSIMFVNNILAQPCIALATETAVYIYKNLKPFFKFNIPTKEWDRDEVNLYNNFIHDNVKDFLEGLSALKAAGVQLSDRSLDILSEPNPKRQIEMIDETRQYPYTSPNSPTCVEPIKSKSDDEIAVSQLIIGTENKELYVLDNTGTNLVKQFILKGTPTFIDVAGIWDGEHRIIALTREASAYIIKNGELLKQVIELESKPCGIAKIERSIYFGCMDKNIHAFNMKVLEFEIRINPQTNKKTFSLKVPAHIHAMESLEYTRGRPIKGYLVGLENHELRIYNERQLVHILPCDVTLSDIIAGLRFGTFGREDGALIIMYKKKGLDVKILQRQFNINQSSIIANKLQQEQDTPLNMPKKTKLFVEQSQRERDQAPEMYRTYMKDLFKIKLKVAQNYVKSLREGALQATGGGPHVRLHAQVDGIGPIFKLRIELENMDNLPVYDLKMTYSFDNKLYKIPKPPLGLPVLVPGVPYPLEVMVESIDAAGTNDTIKVFVIDTKRNVPIVSGMVNMPLSELKID